MGEIFAEFLGIQIHHGSRGGERLGQFAHDGVDQSGFGGTRQRFCLLDGMMNNFRDAAVVLIIHRFD
jgi:hypothetical protein